MSSPLKVVTAAQPPDTAPPLAGSMRERVRAYADLAKIKIFDNYLSVLLAWALLPTSQAGDGRRLAVLGCLLGAQVGTLTAACAYDDVAGVRDGIDTFNYDPQATLRSRTRKPILDARLSEAQALRYARVASGLGVALYVGALIAAELRPWWLAPALLLVIVCVLSYSWGPRLSYRGPVQDLVVIGCAAANVVLTFAAASGHVTGTVVAMGLVCGAWLMQLTAYGNVNDREGDRRAGRRTVPTMLSAGRLRAYLLSLYAFGWGVLLVGVVSGALHWWALLLQAPAVALQIYAIAKGIFGGQVLRARLVGLVAFRVGWIGLFATALLSR